MTPDVGSGRHLTDVEISAAGGVPKGVGHAIKEREHGNDVNSFRDLVFAPAMAAKLLNIVGRGAIAASVMSLAYSAARARHGQAGIIQFAFQNCRTQL